MRVTNKNFGIFVIVIVVLTGAGFGTLTGFAYSENPLRITAAGIAGVVSSFILAKYYLFLLGKIAVKGYNRKMLWLLSTLAAIICGVICTTLIHGIMILIVVCYSKMPLGQRTDGFWPIFLMVGELVGACAGLIVGGICSWIYVLRIMKESNETA